MIQSTKMEWVKRATEINPWGTKWFAWIDFGIAHVFKTPEATLTRLRNIRPPSTRGFHTAGIWPHQTSKLWHQTCWRFAGGFFIGDIDTVREVEQQFRDTVLQEQPKFAWEINMWARMELNGVNMGWFPSEHNDTIIPYSLDMRWGGIYPIGEMGIHGVNTNKYMPIVRSSTSSVYWFGGYSSCCVGGAIEKYVEESIAHRSIPVSLIFTQSDGFIGSDEGRCVNSNSTESQRTQLEMMKIPGTYPILATLCSRYIDKHNMIYMPLDDETFRIGLRAVIDSIVKPEWKDRKNVVFWRGGSSGIDRPTLRASVTELLIDHPNTDVRITKWGGWENGHNIPEEHFGDRCDLSKHCENKYILIIDGNCIASNHQWVFGSGSVPIMITHPDNRYWFQKHLIPMVNYVPIRYDLSDLKEKIDWLIANDEKANEIARNALALSDTIFTPEYQKKYIDSEIRRVLYGSESDIDRLYREKIRTPSDINEHIPTLYEYARKCDSVVECGVRAITSSYAFANGLIGNPRNSLTMVDTYRSENIDSFIEMCEREGVNVKFLHGSDTACELVATDMLFIDTWHVYGHLKRELAYWHGVVRKYIIMHDTTVDADHGETIRCGLDAQAQSIESGYPIEEIRRGLWPAVIEFLNAHPEWVIERRYINNNGLTILRRTT